MCDGLIPLLLLLFVHSLFSLRPVTHSVGDLMEQIRSEDRGIDRVVLKTIGKDTLAVVDCHLHFYLFYWLVTGSGSPEDDASSSSS